MKLSIIFDIIMLLTCLFYTCLCNFYGEYIVGDSYIRSQGLAFDIYIVDVYIIYIPDYIYIYNYIIDS